MSLTEPKAVPSSVNPRTEVPLSPAASGEVWRTASSVTPAKEKREKRTNEDETSNWLGVLSWKKAQEVEGARPILNPEKAP
jgi:hypothetical protein